ncbi:hypothetical protein L596_023304 [Steinernema carpocapsae]|nr:hypothetical protein L596_023304 [Steinernema carpocapsae]
MNLLLLVSTLNLCASLPMADEKPAFPIGLLPEEYVNLTKGLSNADFSNLSQLRGSFFSDSIKEFIEVLRTKNADLAQRVESFHVLWKEKMKQISKEAKEFMVEFVSTVYNTQLLSRSSICSGGCAAVVQGYIPRVKSLLIKKQTEIRVFFANIDDFFRAYLTKPAIMGSS